MQFFGTHPVQLGILGIVLVLNIFSLAAVNNIVRRRLSNQKDAADTPTKPEHTSWNHRRNSYWALIAASVSLAWWLDCHYEMHYLLKPVKSYIFAFPLGILDLYYSETSGVPLSVVLGASLWCSSVYFRYLFVGFLLGPEAVEPVSVEEFSLLILARELLRYVVGLPLVGLLSDLIFSPMHRLAHHPKVYAQNHKTHHAYTNKLTSLVLYHGEFFDDFMMPFTTSIGGTLYVLLLYSLGLHPSSATSNVTGYLMIFNTLLSHAHDTRCARLMAPLPDDLNFVAYHYVHHLSPCHNYGLTRPSDLVWDRILGVDTIRALRDFDH